MTGAVGRRQGTGRRIAAGLLVLLNLGLVALNLDKQDLLPVSTGLWATDDQEVTDTDTDGASVEDSASTTVSVATTVTTDSSVETLVDDTETTTIDDWPGGQGPLPDGPPVARRAVIDASGAMVLTGSAPNWATAMRIADYAGANLPGGVGVVDNQLTWHPDASTDVRSGDVVIDQAATFAIGDAVIDPESFPILDLTAEILQSRPSLFVVVIGHTDDVGDTELNAQLALDRANAVVNYLVEAGVIGGQLVVASAGEDDPTASNETVEGREANRRIELQFKNFLIPPQEFGLP